MNMALGAVAAMNIAMAVLGIGVAAIQHSRSLAGWALFNAAVAGAIVVRLIEVLS